MFFTPSVLDTISIIIIKIVHTFFSNIIRVKPYLRVLEIAELKEDEYSYKPISTPKKTAKSTAVTTNIELASSPEDFKSENFLTFTS